MPKISVIIPIYKTGKILEKTLQSIRKQTFEDFECLLIDDGSYDKKTESICKKIISYDCRFKYFAKANEGIEKTRLYGVRKSNTPLLIFCDHDDYYERNAFEKLHENFLKSKADIVVANCYSQRIFNNILSRSKSSIFIPQEIVVNHDDFVATNYLNFFGIHSFSVSTWGKLYKKKLFNDSLELFGINILEDIVTNIQLFERASKIHFITDYVYTHVYGGLSSVFVPNYAITVYSQIYDFRKSYLNKYKLPVKPLLIEYKNIINQNINLMTDNGFKIDEFKNIVEIINNTNIFKDLLLSLTESELGNYIKLISLNDFDNLYALSNKNNTLSRRLKHRTKKLYLKLIKL